VGRILVCLAPLSLDSVSCQPLHPSESPSVALDPRGSAPFAEQISSQLHQIENAVDLALGMPDRPEVVESYPALISAMETVVALREHAQGAICWETLGSRQRLAELRNLSVLEKAERRVIGEIAGLHLQSLRLYREGQFARAAELGYRALDCWQELPNKAYRLHAHGLDRLAASLEALARWQEALSHSQAALEAYQRLYGGDHPEVAEALGSVAAALESLNRLPEALPLREMSLAMLQRLYPEDHASVAAALNDLAVCLESLGQSDEALARCQSALAMYKRLYAFDHPDIARSLGNVGYCLDSLGRSTEALTFHRAALAMRTTLHQGDHHDIDTSLNNLARCLSSLGLPLEALPKYEASLAMRQRLHSGDHRDVAAGLNNVATCLDSLGRSVEALPMHKSALAMRQRLFSGDHPDIAASLNNLAYCLDSLGRSEAALPQYQAALAMRQRLFTNASHHVALSLNNLAGCLTALERPAEALPLYEEALAIQQTLHTGDHPALATSLSNVAFGLDALGRFSDALPIHMLALGMRERLFPGDHPDVATSLNNVAACLNASGHSAEALPLYQSALAMRTRLFGLDHPLVAMSFSNLGIMLAGLGRQQEAAEYLLSSTSLLWGYLTQTFPVLSPQQKRQFLARSRFLQGDRLWPLVFLHDGTDAEAAWRGVLLSKQLLLETARQESQALLTAAANSPSEWQVRWREREQLRGWLASAALQGWLTGATPLSEETRPSTGPTQVRALAERIEELDTQLRQGNPAYLLDARLRQVSLEDVSQVLRERQVLLEYVRYRDYDFSCTATNRWGPPYYGVLILSGDDHRVSALNLGKAHPIDAAVRRFRSEMETAIEQFKIVEPSPAQLRRAERSLAQASRTLREAVWEPLSPWVSGCERIYLAPDGLLNLVPFEALAQETGSATCQYLAEQHEFVYLCTGRDLARLAVRSGIGTGASKTAALIGNPAFSARPPEVARVVVGLKPANGSLAWSEAHAGVSTLGGSLPWTHDAKRLTVPRNWQQLQVLDHLIERVRGQLEQLGWSVLALTQELAVEEAVLQLEAPRILQFATHGYIMDRPNLDPEDWDNPFLRSMLFLAGANQWTPATSVYHRAGETLFTTKEALGQGFTPEMLQASRVEVADGILTAYEVTGMNLHGTDLVNLTACETGLGEVTTDGVAGLRQAFLLAGARALTMSMWEVPAEETAQQIEDFYARWLTADSGKAQPTLYSAFRQAQLSALARARAGRGAGHPFHWAGVVYVGDPGDL
jgi:tetratricopeptide (TPR) repeat protein/CHAT domain-containing protein